MALWLYDTEESRRTGQDAFRLPYPMPGQWARERRVNTELLDLMRYAIHVYRLFTTPKSKWDKKKIWEPSR